MEKYKVSQKKVYTTNDYSLFKELLGNREVKNDRVQKIINSINEVGYISNPIIVNEKYEVIDGQGRLKAFEYLGLQVEFIIHNGAGIEECRSLNIYQKNWSMRDYIESHAKNGNDDYKWMLYLADKHHKITLDNLCALCWHKGRTMSVVDKNKINAGDLKLTEKDRTRISNVADYLDNFTDVAHYVGGRKFIFYTALTFCFNHSECDNERLMQIILKRYREIPACHTVNMYLEYFEKLYNENLRKNNRIYLEHDYEINH